MINTRRIISLCEQIDQLTVLIGQGAAAHGDGIETINALFDCHDIQDEFIADREHLINELKHEVNK